MTEFQQATLFVGWLQAGVALFVGTGQSLLIFYGIKRMSDTSEGRAEQTDKQTEAMMKQTDAIIKRTEIMAQQTEDMAKRTDIMAQRTETLIKQSETTMLALRELITRTAT